MPLSHIDRQTASRGTWYMKEDRYNGAEVKCELRCQEREREYSRLYINSHGSCYTLNEMTLEDIQQTLNIEEQM